VDDNADVDLVFVDLLRANVSDPYNMDIEHNNCVRPERWGTGTEYPGKKPQGVCMKRIEFSCWGGVCDAPAYAVRKNSDSRSIGEVVADAIARKNKKSYAGLRSDGNDVENGEITYACFVMSIGERIRGQAGIWGVETVWFQVKV
jgi:hypothetical protein